MTENYIYRQTSEKLQRLMDSFPVVVVTGARQVGKTTLLKHLFGDGSDYVVFDPTNDVGNARSDPDLFLRNHPGRLLLDEIQYAPELVSAIKRSVDQDRRPGRFLLTGSQQWGIMKNLSESLAGRAVFLDLHGFDVTEHAQVPVQTAPWLEKWLEKPTWEMVSSWSVMDLSRPLPEFLFRGSLPEATRLPLAVVRTFHEGYQRTYIERDVRALTNVNEFQLFGRFLRLAAALTAQEVNRSHLGRDIGVTPKTAANWLAVLSGTHQWIEIPPYSGNTVKRVAGKSKGYIADTGMACMGLGISTPGGIEGHPQFGALFETAVVSDILKLCARMVSPPTLYHWRTYGGAEVDVILERDGRLYPIEIKSTSRISRNDARGIGAFRKTYPSRDIAPGLILAPVLEPFRVSDRDFAVPWHVGVRST